MINKKSLKIKIVIDVIMTLLLFMVMANKVTRSLFHEIIGIVILGLFIIHNVLNRYWYKNVLKKTQNSLSKIRKVNNILLLIAVIGLIITSLSISRKIIPFSSLINIPYGREVHILCAYWLFILISIHIGTHCNMINGILSKIKMETESHSMKNSVLKIPSIVIGVYGFYAFIKRRFLDYLFLYNSYTFWNYNEWSGLFFIDLICIMLLFLFVTSFVINKISGGAHIFKIIMSKKHKR